MSELFQEPRPEDMRDFANRLTAVENAQREQAARSESRHVDNQKEMGKLETEVKGIREQARAHNKKVEDRFERMETRMANDKKSTDKLIESQGKEIFSIVDNISRAFGLDEDPKAAKNLQALLSDMAKHLKTSEEDRLWIRRGIIGLLITGGGYCIITGAKAILGS